MGTCLLNGCENKSRARGMCTKHYQRWKSNGDPKKARPKRISGTGTIENGYLRFRKNYISKPAHVFIFESVLGKEFLLPHVGHHIDGNKLNNENNNLIACEDDAYHHLLHRRKRALLACGNPTWRKCPICKMYDDPVNMKSSGHHFEHRHCRNLYQKNRKAGQNDKSRRTT